MTLVSLQRTIVVASTCFLASCQMTPIAEEKEHIQQTINASIEQTKQQNKPFVVPPRITQQLMPSLLQNKSMPIEKRFDIAAKDVDVRSFFSSLVSQTPYSVAFHNELSGSLSLNLKQVTLSEALEAVSDLYGYRIEKQGRIFQIYPASISTETFSFNYLLLKRNGTSQTSISSGGITERNSNGSNSNNANNSSNSRNNNSSGGASGANGNAVNGTYIESVTETNYWQELEKTLTSLISGEGRKVILSPQSGLVTVRGYPQDIQTVKRFLAQSEENLQRQVILEARIVEVTLHDGFQQGIEWENLLSHVGSGDITDFNFSTSPSVISDPISAALGGVASLSFKNANFSGVVSLLSTQGDVNVLSSPRITAINNQKAVIKVGNDEYFVTDVSSTSSSVGDNVVSNPEVELTPFFSGIALDVTPQIDDEGQVLLHVHPSVIDVVEQQKTIELQGGSFQLPLANSSIRETDTIIKSASGDVVVIGGLMSSRTTDNTSKVPLLGSIPLLGELFTNRKEQVKKTELIILIKPVVVGEGTWQKQLEKSQQLLEKWYPK
ncbi:pilus (MSHA type) biogenesis protein MshL [Psychrobium sp. 1_MG-2023]|uniref:pilus (MSHA type) biogenesis protein MshL n=1 Tax=Psychrobium sp. 1_MG-2023 TaxID=3062624 RepID=UPI000C346FE9|nr:pilus (MSHA type) biogenesis protein MshL [Psychrobium sp. 1_MG-2023]MDP2560865.1 pilus (MSHA type) biogenesis protein MshL [Psychrobium sp. 1_MG-2023]PKF56738.1 pilus (MSHA type) biogenesis protein MshL [Alteromonadales bacterium alter-6D02]